MCRGFICGSKTDHDDASQPFWYAHVSVSKLSEPRGFGHLSVHQNLWSFALTKDTIRYKAFHVIIDLWMFPIDFGHIFESETTSTAYGFNEAMNVLLRHHFTASHIYSSKHLFGSVDRFDDIDNQLPTLFSCLL